MPRWQRRRETGSRQSVDQARRTQAVCEREGNDRAFRSQHGVRVAKDPRHGRTQVVPAPPAQRVQDQYSGLVRDIWSADEIASEGRADRGCERKRKRCQPLPNRTEHLVHLHRGELRRPHPQDTIVKSGIADETAEAQDGVGCPGKPAKGADERKVSGLGGDLHDVAAVGQEQDRPRLVSIEDIGRANDREAATNLGPERHSRKVT